MDPLVGRKKEKEELLNLYHSDVEFSISKKQAQELRNK